MTKFGTFETHARLVERMAGALGVDLEERAQRGVEVSEVEATDRVYRCLSCTAPDMCVKFLDAQAEMGAPALSATRYCRNKAELERLAAE
ncbi:DUF6455 family protein [Celeribacter sp. PS-C1]|uniref:DUF6455 family protein n=1 Tax=Celeribacter sp. PS-C1 TaxID=2820813 RepID=UPI001C72104F|nr:DUF6455 family protein [Celeribacter sp. PS-C1]MBW6418406.1 hypothetical protein [Celeribacter sp. PS-C1]